MDPTDFSQVKLHQKTDRQILFLLAGVIWVLETMWDMIKGSSGEKPKKTKSIIGGKKKKVDKAEKIE